MHEKYLPICTTRCGLLAKTIYDEEEAAVFYKNLESMLGRENNEIIREIMLDEADHKQKFKRIYKSLCVATSEKEEETVTIGGTVVKESW